MDILPDIPNHSPRSPYYIITITIITITLVYHHLTTTTHTIQQTLPQPPSRYGQPPISITPSTTNSSSYFHSSSPLSLITAILVVNSLRDWKTQGQVPYQQTVQRLNQYPYISEIIIWNNDLSTHISTRDYDDQSTKLRIFNLPGDMGSDDPSLISHHLACSLATFSNCYFQDELSPIIHLDSLYTLYTETGSKHITTISSTPYQHIIDPNLYIYTPTHEPPLNHLISPKSYSSRYIRQLSHSPIQFNSFATWTNNPIQTVLISNHQITHSIHSNHSLETLQNILNLSDPTIIPEPFPFPISLNSFSSISTQDDQFMILIKSTNLGLQNILNQNLNLCYDLNEKMIELVFIKPIQTLFQFSMLSNIIKINKIPPYKILIQSLNSSDWITVKESKGGEEIKVNEFIKQNKVKRLKIEFVINDKERSEVVSICGILINDQLLS